MEGDRSECFERLVGKFFMRWTETPDRERKCLWRKWFSRPALAAAERAKAVVVASGKDLMFCAGANIRMLGQSPHWWKVNFCKFTNETRNGIEDAAATSGQSWIAKLNGTAAGGGYELALATDYIMLIDDGSAAVSLPELPLLAVLPGTGGLTRVADKRRLRHAKRRNNQQIVLGDYVLTQPPVYSGPPKPIDPTAPIEEPPPSTLPCGMSCTRPPSCSCGTVW